MSYILEKTERISSAVTRLASIIDDNRPLQTGLQTCAIGLVKDAAASSDSRVARGALTARLVELVGLTELARHAHALSEMNADILTTEVQALLSLMREVEWQRGRSYLPESTYAVHMEEVPLPYQAQSPAPHPFKVQTKDTLPPRSQPVPSPYRHDEKDTDNAQTSTHSQGPKTARAQEAQKDRRATILGLLQRRDRISVKDVATVIKDCSEKTLQRELLALVAQGVLKKEGERRWSTYRLA